jgi:GNAT superfamily N-acetyltransferase
MRTAIRATQHHYHDLIAHFLALGPRDRSLRFGWALTDEQIVAYVESLLDSGDTVLIVAEPGRGISGVLHLESMGCGVTLGLSVSPQARGLGIGTLLMQRAALLARVHGVRTVFVRSLSRNAALQRLGVRLRMKVVCAPPAVPERLEGPVADARDPASAQPITLADDALRSQWNGASSDLRLPEVAEAVLP